MPPDSSSRDISDKVRHVPRAELIGAPIRTAYMRDCLSGIWLVRGHFHDGLLVDPAY